MVTSINEELEAAEAAKAAINALLTTTPKSAIVAILRKANTAAILNWTMTKFDPELVHVMRAALLGSSAE